VKVVDRTTRRAHGALSLLVMVSMCAACASSSVGAQQDGSTSSSQREGSHVGPTLDTARPDRAPVATASPTATPIDARMPAASDAPSPAPTLAPRPDPTATPVPSPSSSPSPAPVALRPPPRPGRFKLDLYEPDDHVPQYDEAWCVPASMQMMINLMDTGRPDRSRGTQRELYDLARRWSPWLTDRPGASTHGWIGGLQLLGHGSFWTKAYDSRAEALHEAARRMRLTRKPVGLLVWRGDHAWVMSGFKATADPAYTDDYEVTAVWIEDPWYGRTSRLWGAGLAPHTLMTADELAGDFMRWASEHRPEFGPKGKFVIIAPVV
jgi:hypothetical protein